MTLTQKDIDQIGEIIDQKLEERIKFLPTKDEFYTKMDEVMGELKAIREEHTVSSGQISDHEDRITLLEEKTGLAPA
ncbi:MAG: hypothetical protein Q7S60_01750 [bacterium]|nr:hypothetical protein [bacterium]